MHIIKNPTISKGYCRTNCMLHAKNPPILTHLSDIYHILLPFRLFPIHFAVFAVFSFFEKGSFKFLKLAVSFYSQIRHIFPIYYKRSQKDAPFYFPPAALFPEQPQAPLPNFRAYKKAYYTFVCLKYSNTPSPLGKSSPPGLLFSLSLHITLLPNRRSKQHDDGEDFQSAQQHIHTQHHLGKS